MATFPPIGGRLVGRRFIGFPPSGGKLLSEAKLMRGRMIEPRADENIRPYIVVACAVSLASA